jgi:hypothetical protein
MHLYVPHTDLLVETSMAEDRDHNMKEKVEKSISLESVIAMGLFGWLALSMALMGLGIW